MPFHLTCASSNDRVMASLPLLHNATARRPHELETGKQIKKYAHAGLGVRAEHQVIYMFVETLRAGNRQSSAKQHGSCSNSGQMTRMKFGQMTEEWARAQS